MPEDVWKIGSEPTASLGDPMNWGVSVGSDIRIFDYQQEEWGLKVAGIIREALLKAQADGVL